MILEGTPAQKKSAQDTLYTALEGALLLIHPFMPFITEELWQRLPRRPLDTTRTVCKAAFPVFQPTFENPSADSDYDLIFKIVKAIRSLTSEYSIKDAAEIYVHSKDATTLATITAQVPSVQALVKGIKSIVPEADAAVLPHGLTAIVVSDACTVYLMVKGRVNVDAEIAKTVKKIAKIEEARKRLEKARAVKDYQSKVKAEVQEADKERLVAYSEEAKTLEEQIGRAHV